MFFTSMYVMNKMQCVDLYILYVGDGSLECVDNPFIWMTWVFFQSLFIVLPHVADLDIKGMSS